MKRVLTFLLLLAAAIPVRAELPAPVAKALRAAGVPQDAVSVFVQRADRSKPLLAHRAGEAMNPASVMKLVTTYAGLELLGPAYTWRTEVYASAPVADGVLNGDLILKGYGDPALTLEHFWLLVRTLRQTGLREIRGDLVLDRAFFADGETDPGAFDGEPYRAYNALPDALLVNFTATRFRFAGDAQNGRVNIAVDPELSPLRVVNRLQLTCVPCADWKDRLGYQVRREGEEAVVFFDGSYSLACGDKALELSVLDESSYAYQLFRRLWQEQGGVLHGGVRPGAVPPGAVLQAQAASPPLADVIRLINKYSNNVMARQLLISIGAERLGEPGSREKGGEAVRAWLAGKGLAFPELVIENGAGLSRQERISARHLGQLLLAAYASPAMPELMSSLPVVAVDGTLAHRLRDSRVAGRAHLKSGSLDGVRAVAGYLLDAKGRRWVVVFLANHPRAAGSAAAQDALLEWLYRRE